MKLIDFIRRRGVDLDVDVCDDYDESCNIAYCGTQLTADGEKEFDDVLQLELIDESVLKQQIADGCVVLCVDRFRNAEKIVKRLSELFCCMAGFVSEELWNRWFVDEEA